MLVVKVPGLNNLGKNDCCRNAGNAILEKLKEIYSNENGKIVDKSKLNIEEIHLDNNNLEEQEKLIYENAKEILEEQDKVVFLGGDHSISYSIGKAFLDYSKKKGVAPCLIVFDAHADCMKPVKNPTHEEWLRALIESGFPSENVLLVGARNLWQEELNFLQEKGIKKIKVNELINNLEEITDVIMEFSQGKELYVSFDIDVIDPAFAPSTGYLEPCGLTSRQAIYILSRINKMKNLKIFDLVEINSEKDKKYNNLTTKLGAKLIAELL